MRQPPSTYKSLPFFAYGVFKPGELAFFRIAPYVRCYREDTIAGRLLDRDGLPIASSSGNGIVPGYVLWFREGQEQHAYDQICHLEPAAQYDWATTKPTHLRKDVVFLNGLYPEKGTVPLDHGVWTGEDDPFFTTAFHLIAEIQERVWHDGFDERASSLLRMEMAYMLLWSIIERYTSLRYNLSGNHATAKIASIASEKEYKLSLQRNAHETRFVFHADEPWKKETLDPRFAKSSSRYYHQVRCNMIHRGKAALDDFGTVQKSLDELTQIVADTINAGFEESRSLKASLEQRGP